MVKGEGGEAGAVEGVGWECGGQVVEVVGGKIAEAEGARLDCEEEFDEGAGEGDGVYGGFWDALGLDDQGEPGSEEDPVVFSSNFMVDVGDHRGDL